MATGSGPASTSAPALRALLDTRTVKALAGTRTFDRGSAYGADDRVSVSLDTAERIEAHVRGTKRYNVDVWVDDGELYWRCTCPAADDGFREVITATRNLLVAKDQSSGRDIVEVTEHALDRLVDATQFVDDDGDIAGPVDDLTDLHFDACAVASFDPIELAHRLVELESRWPDFAPFFGAAQAYVPLLGPRGRMEMQRLTRAVWESMTPPQDGMSSGWSRVHGRMIAMARTSGDADELIAVHGRDRSTARAHVEIVEALRAAGRNDEAIDLAERALAEPGPWTSRAEIREHLAALLIDRGAHDRARELFWDVFAAEQSIQAYRRWLHAPGPDRHAAADRAIEWLRPVAEAAASAGGEGLVSTLGFSPQPVHTLIEVPLTEGRTDDAWDTARELHYVGPLVPKLAEAREASHPLDAVGVYETMMFRQIHLKSNDAYASAVELMGRILQLCERADALDRFDAVLTKVRTGHKPKRNLMKLLDQRHWD